MRALLSLVVALISCGDPLADGEFGGDAKLSFQVLVCGDQQSGIVPLNPRVGILWKTYDQTGWILTEVTDVGATVFPAVVDVEIFGRPPERAPSIVQSDAGLIEADLGCPILFDDLDYDGSFGDADAILAVSWNQLLGFVRDDQKYELFEGVCSEDGLPSGKMSILRDRPVDVRFLEAPNVFPETKPSSNCVDFF